MLILLAVRLGLAPQPVAGPDVTAARPTCDASALPVAPPPRLTAGARATALFAVPVGGVLPAVHTWRAPDRPTRAIAFGVVPPPDEWFAEDKLRHFFLSFSATAMAYGAARTFGLDHGPAAVVAGTSAATAGVWKEFHDRSIGRPFSGKDLVWDGIGIVAGLILTSQTH